MNENSRDPRTHAVIGAAMEVHNVLGRGFLEPVYQSALAAELTTRNVPYRREVDLPVWYKGRLLDCHYRADFICFGEVIVELKALTRLGGPEEAQLMNYLKATGFSIGLLLNFGGPRLEYQRLIMTPKDGYPQMNADSHR